MARTVAALATGARITDYISLGVITKTFPLSTVRAVLTASGKTSLRERDLPAHVMMYYVIALALYMQASYREVLRCLLEGLQWLRDPATPLKVAGKSGISQARTRLGWEALRQLHDAMVRPIALPATRGAWYRQWRLVSLDGSTLDVADEAVNAAAFGRPGSSRGGSAYPDHGKDSNGILIHRHTQLTGGASARTGCALNSADSWSSEPSVFVGFLSLPGMCTNL